MFFLIQYYLVMTLNKGELQKAIENTLEEILQVKEQILSTADVREKGTLKRKLKELQYLQLWNIEQMSIIKNKEIND